MRTSYVNAKGEVIQISLMDSQYLLNAYNYYRKHPANFVGFKAFISEIYPIEVVELQDIFTKARDVMVDSIQVDVKDLVASLKAEINKRKLNTKGGENNMRRKPTAKVVEEVDEEVTTLKRYTVRSLDSFKNQTRLVDSYVKYLDRNDLYAVYSQKFGYDNVRANVRKMLIKAWEKAEVTGNLTIRDSVIEKWAKEEGIRMVN